MTTEGVLFDFARVDRNRPQGVNWSRRLTDEWGGSSSLHVRFGRRALTRTKPFYSCSLWRETFAVSAGPHAAPAALAAARRIQEQPAATGAGTQPFARQGEVAFDREHGQKGGDGFGVPPPGKGQVGSCAVQSHHPAGKSPCGAPEQEAQRFRRGRLFRGNRSEDPGRCLPDRTDPLHERLACYHGDRSGLASAGKPGRLEPVSDIPGGFEQLVVRARAPFGLNTAFARSRAGCPPIKCSCTHFVCVLATEHNLYLRVIRLQGS